MNPPACPEYAELLVEYADGALASADTARVAAHVDTCAACRRRVANLRLSLTTAREIWARTPQAGAVRADARRVRRRFNRAHRRMIPLAAGVAAAAAVLCAVWMPGPQAAHDQGPVADAVRAAQLEREIRDIGLSEQMLAAARVWAETPGGRVYAAECYELISAQYPQTAAARQARADLATLPKG